jgi:hypothetical protein
MTHIVYSPDTTLADGGLNRSAHVTVRDGKSNHRTVYTINASGTWDRNPEPNPEIEAALQAAEAETQKKLADLVELHGVQDAP